MNNKKPLGEILVEDFTVTSSDVEKSLQFQDKFGGLLGSIMLNMGIISEETLITALAQQLEIKTYKDLDVQALDFSTDHFAADGNIPFLLNRQWLPLSSHEHTVTFAAMHPLNYEVIQYLLDKKVAWDTCLVTESQFRELEASYRLKHEMDDAGSLENETVFDLEVEKLREMASEAPVVNLVNSLIIQAVNRQASDLHFEPYKTMYRVRFRIDGILHDIDFLPAKMQLPFISRIKILAGMDIAERRRPQDGQISMKVAGHEIDIRVSTIPLAEGESLVMRFLIKENVRYELHSLGLEEDLIGFLEADIRKTAGVILITGPTGSGKTTTLYSCLNKLNSEDKKIITIEDPVEYKLNGINQIQVQPDIDYNFVNALRSILRQDPDIIMVGEIRDRETAQVALQSSLTGHLVFSTVHTNNAPSAYTRLIDLGVEEYLINSSLISVIAQRLVRKICPHCAEPSTLPADKIKTYSLDKLANQYTHGKIDLKHGKGCEKCSFTGFLGRVSIMEYLDCDAFIQGIPKDTNFISKAFKHMADKNIRTLAEDGLLKAVKGKTTIEEVLRVCI